MMRCLACRAEYPYTLLLAQIGAMARRRAEEVARKAEELQEQEVQEQLQHSLQK
jgi:hypothetical protein